MQALVTGGGGFLGRYIVEKLRARGDGVRIFARGHYPEVETLGADCRQGDLRDPAAVAAACEGMDVVFHVAAKAALWGAREDFEAINVTGTANVIGGCRAHGVRRLVYTSSPSVVFAQHDIEGGDESLPYPRRFLAEYPRSKAAAEQLVLAANNAELATCALRPHLIWGPRDTHILPMIVQRARSGQLVQIGNGDNRVSISYVENVADAHLLAADALAPGSKVAGQAYFINDREPVQLWAWVRNLLERVGEPPPGRRIGYGTAYALATVLEAAWRYLPLRGEPRLTRFTVGNFARSHWFRIDKAAKDFGWQPAVDPELGLERSVDWFHLQ